MQTYIVNTYILCWAFFSILFFFGCVFGLGDWALCMCREQLRRDCEKSKCSAELGNRKTYRSWRQVNTQKIITAPPTSMYWTNLVNIYSSYMPTGTMIKTMFEDIPARFQSRIWKLQTHTPKKSLNRQKNPPGEQMKVSRTITGIWRKTSTHTVLPRVLRAHLHE